MKQEDVHRALKHIGAHAAEGEPADEEGEDQEDGLHLVESKMHLVAGDETDDQDGGDGEPDGGKRRAETHIHRALHMIDQRRVEGG